MKPTICPACGQLHEPVKTRRWSEIRRKCVMALKRVGGGRIVLPGGNVILDVMVNYPELDAAGIKLMKTDYFDPTGGGGG